MPKKKKGCEKECNFYLYGPGVERINEEIKEKYKNYRVEILTSDVMSNQEKGKKIIKEFESQKIKIIIDIPIETTDLHDKDKDILLSQCRDIMINNKKMYTAEHMHPYKLYSA